MKRVRIYPPCPECMDPELKSGGQWIQKATASIKRRGTEGKCTGSNYGGPGCPPGSKAYNLAKTFRKMARERKKEFGGEADQNVNTAEYGAALLGNFRDHLAANAINAFTENTLLDIVQNPVAFQYGGNPASGYGYNPAVYNIDPYIQQQQDLANNFGNSMWDLITGADTAFRTPNSFKAKTKFNRENPYFKEYKKTYREQEKDATELARNPWMQYFTGQMKEGGNTGLPKFQGAGESTPARDLQLIGNWFSDIGSGIGDFFTKGFVPGNDLRAAEQWLIRNQGDARPTQSNNPVIVKPTTQTTQTSTPKSTVLKPVTITAKSPIKKSNAAGTGSTKTQITDDDIYGPSYTTGTTSTTSTSAAEKVEASRRGNVSDEEETQTTTTGMAPASNHASNYGYNPYNPYYNPFVVYPQMGMFGQRTGRMPIAFDPRNTSLGSIEYRQNWWPGKDKYGNKRQGQIKRITFDHYAPSNSGASVPKNPTTTTTPVTKSWTAPEVTATDEERTFSEKETPYWRDDERMFEYGGGLPRFQYLGEVPELEQERRRKELTQFPAGAWPIWMQKPKGTNSGKTDAENIQEWNDSIADDTPWSSTFLKKASPFARTMIGPALSAAASIGRQLTAPQYDLEDLTAAERVFTPKRRGDMGEIPFNFAGNYMDVAGYTPVQNKGYTAKKGGNVRKFQQGGTYNLTEEEIQDLLASGAEIEFID